MEVSHSVLAVGLTSKNAVRRLIALPFLSLINLVHRSLAPPTLMRPPGSRTRALLVASVAERCYATVILGFTTYGGFITVTITTD
jgi:hypothetical protein